MNSQNENFIVNRWKSMGYALRGCWLLITTERAIQVHLVLSLIFVLLGCLMNLNPLGWVIQTLIFGIILAVESLNTAVEKICDFVHEDFHHKIGFIKDISAGAVTFIVVFSYISLLFLYIHYNYS